MQDIKAIVRRFPIDNLAAVGNVVFADDTSFIEGHILDSTGFVELMTLVEETFELKVEDDDMLPENFDSLLNIEGYIGRKRAARTPA